MELLQPATHLDHMIRQTRAHHVSLSLMADNKAHMMLTISALLVPLSIRFLYDPRTHLAAMTMVAFSILTVLLAAYAAMPKMPIPKNNHDVDDMTAPSFNILFFGTFARMTFAEYEQAMGQVMKDHNTAYAVQLKEIYEIGRYLAQKKYRYVRYSFYSFLAGVISSSFIYILSEGLR
jgi:hypothetical protein